MCGSGIKAKDIYPNGIEKRKYQDILNVFGGIAVQVDDVYYSGDSRLLYFVAGKFGYLQFGWGSCSGCDALEACNTIEEVQELIEQLYNSIRWFDSVNEALYFFKNHDWQGEYSYDDTQIDFINKSIEYLMSCK